MTTLLAFIVTLAVLIVVHEFGHFIVARLAGVRVLRFSVGFGRVLASRVDRHGTQWSISALPLGGYVKMLDEREAPVPEALLSQAFNRKSLAARTAIVAAGPLANFLLALLLFWGLNLNGVPAFKPVLGEPPAGSVAALAGIRDGDTVLSVAGEPVTAWQEVHWRVLKYALRGETFRIETVDARQHYAARDIAPPALDQAGERDPLRALGFVQYLPPIAPVIGHLTPDGPASLAGLRAGDRVRAVNGRAVAHWDALVEEVRASAGKPLRLSIERGANVQEVSVTPQVATEGERTVGRIGAAPQIDPTLLEPLRTTLRYGVWNGLLAAFDRLWDMSAFSLEMLGRMITGQASLDNLSGPLSIADYAGQSAEHGALSFLAFLAVVSLSLGVLNLLPVPLLDGGHLLYYAAEFVTGRPVSEAIQETGQKIGIALLGALMFIALFNDLNRFLAG